MYWRVISAIGISRMSRFCRLIRYSSMSSGPSNASRNTSSACGGMYRSRGISVTGWPSTTANGISACAGAAAAAGGGGAAVGTSVSSGFIWSTVVDVHGLTNRIQCFARRRARALASFSDDTAYQFGILLKLLRTLGNRRNLLDHLVDQRRLALQAADARGAASPLHPPLSVGI